MKKILLFIASILSSGFLMAQINCSDIFISEYVEGWYNNKALELYNPTSSPITLDNTYRLVRFDNGKTTSDQDPLYVCPLTGSIDAFNVMVIVQDTTKPGQDTMVWAELRNKATWLAPYDYGGTTPGGNCVFWNGDDAVSLQKKQTNGTWTDIDIFGEIGVRPLDWQLGTTGAWTAEKPYWRGNGAYLTKDQTLIRKHTVKYGIDRVAMSHYGDSVTGIYPNSFNAFVEYDSMPANFFDSLGTHWCDCKTVQALNKINAHTVKVQPNPVKNGKFIVSSSSQVIQVEVISLLGKSLLKEQYGYFQRDRAVFCDKLPAGLYLVRVTLADHQEVIEKIIIE
jgi:hypothetical protein